MKACLSQILLVTIVLMAHSVSGQTNANERAIPIDNLSYPVLITLSDGSSGSGFYLNTGQSIFLVTAKHVLFDPNTHVLRALRADVLSYGPTDPTGVKGRNFGTLDLPVLQNDGNVIAHQSEDVVVVRISSHHSPVDAKSQNGISQRVRGFELKESTQGGVLTAHMDMVKTFEQVLVGNEVIMYGSPTSLGLQQQKLNLHLPLLRKGIVAGSNPENRSIILDCPAYFGNSGGPVLEVDRNGLTTSAYLIGVVDQYVPFADQGHANTFVMLSNSGYSIVTPMDFVLELVK